MTDLSLASRIGSEANDEPLLLARRYESLEVIAAGGQGELVRAWDHHHNRPVALKVRPVGPHADRDAVLAETRALLNVRPHPNMAFVRDDFFHGDKHYLVLDWVPGEDLRTRLRSEGRPGLAFDLVTSAASDIASVLDHLHGHNPPVVHGDVKPANIVITDQEERPRAVLVDFGNSSTDQLLGGVTLEYAAPEVLAGGPSSPAADVYALAATTFELLTGRVAVPGATLDWSAVPADQVRYVREALMSGLAVNPDQRAPSATAFVEALTAGRTAQPRRGGVAVARQRRRVRWAIAAALVAGVAMGSVVAAVVASGSTSNGTKSLSEAQLLSGALPSGVHEIGRLGIYQTWGYFNTYAIGDDGSAALVYHQENMAHEWETILPAVDDQLMFYQSSSGGAAVVEWHRYGTLLDLYGVDKLSAGFAHVRQLKSGSVYMYNPKTGANQLVAFTANSEKPTISKLPAIAPGWTTVARISDTQLLHYDATTGKAQLVSITGSGHASAQAVTGLPSGLEAIDGAGGGRIAYADAQEGRLHIATIASGAVRSSFTVDLHGAQWDQEIGIADGRLLFYSGSTGESVLVKIGSSKASLGPKLSLLRAAKVLVGRA